MTDWEKEALLHYLQQIMPEPPATTETTAEAKPPRTTTDFVIDGTCVLLGLAGLAYCCYVGLRMLTRQSWRVSHVLFTYFVGFFAGANVLALTVHATSNKEYFIFCTVSLVVVCAWFTALIRVGRPATTPEIRSPPDVSPGLQLTTVGWCVEVSASATNLMLLVIDINNPRLDPDELHAELDRILAQRVAENLPLRQLPLQEAPLQELPLRQTGRRLLRDEWRTESDA